MRPLPNKSAHTLRAIRRKHEVDEQTTARWKEQAADVAVDFEWVAKESGVRYLVRT